MTIGRTNITSIWLKTDASSSEKIGMTEKNRILLLIDGMINTILGILLLLFPIGIAEFLGLPIPTTHFYPSILGAVLFGIGIALFVEVFGSAKPIRGLGLGGAIAINISGALVLILWLLFGSLSIPFRGRVILWAVGMVVLMIGLLEVFTKPSPHDR